MQVGAWVASASRRCKPPDCAATATRRARPSGPSRRRRPSRVERSAFSLLLATRPAWPRRRHDVQPHALGRVEALPLVGLDPSRAGVWDSRTAPTPSAELVWDHPAQTTGASAGALCGFARGTQVPYLVATMRHLLVRWGGLVQRLAAAPSDNRVTARPQMHACAILSDGGTLAP